MTIEITGSEWQLTDREEPDAVEQAIIRRCELHKQLGVVSGKLSELHIEHNRLIGEIIGVNDQLRTMGVDSSWLANGLQQPALD